MSGRWRYLAYRLNGDGTETLLSNDVPLSRPRITQVLSGAGGITGTLSPEIARLQTDAGDPVFVPWSTAVYAEKDGQLRAGAILDSLKEKGPDLTLRSVSFSAFPDGQPYMGDGSWVKVDPLDMFRHIWTRLQSPRRADLGMTVDDTASPVRIGQTADRVEFETENGEEVSFEAGPYKLSWFETQDLGEELDKLAAETPFDYLEEHRWDGETASHHLRLGYPRLGRRLNGATAPRFVVGENVIEPPEVDWDGEDYADQVLVLGAGQGRKMIRSQVPQRDTRRLHRIAVVQDKSIRNRRSADKLATAEQAARLGEADVDQVVVLDHPNAPLGTYAPGDEILLERPAGWSRQLTLWLRVLAIAIEPETDTATLTVARAEKV